MDNTIIVENNGEFIGRSVPSPILQPLSHRFPGWVFAAFNWPCGQSHHARNILLPLSCSNRLHQQNAALESEMSRRGRDFDVESVTIYLEQKLRSWISGDWSQIIFTKLSLEGQEASSLLPTLTVTASLYA